jgi:hypothetical protein
MPDCVIDTNVLQKVNAPITKEPKTKRKFAKRLALLHRIAKRELQVLVSQRLLTEYNNKIIEPRNDAVRMFVELLTAPGGAAQNWHSPWTGDRDKARKCRFPAHDDHVLRTAIKPGGSTIFTEEGPMLAKAKCIHKEFGVHISDVV